jgi:hypothetical protein
MVALVSAALTLTTNSSLVLGAVSVPGILWLTFFAWRMANPIPRYAHLAVNRSAYFKAFGVGAALLVSGWPIQLALGANPLKPYWPGGQIFTCIIGALVVLSMTTAPPTNQPAKREE